MKKTYTKEERAAYFKELRDRWQGAKAALDAGELEEIQAAIATHGLNVSARSYYIVRVQMAKLGLEGIPYLDCKTFLGWKQSGFMVAKGESSRIHGITWIKTGDDDKEDGFVFPKQYALFHRSQVIAQAA